MNVSNIPFLIRITTDLRKCSLFVINDMTIPRVLSEYFIPYSTKSGMHFIVYCAKFILLMKSVNIRLLSSIYCYSNNNFELTLAMHNQNIVSSTYHHRYNPDLVKLNYQIKSKYHCCNLYITTCCVIHEHVCIGFWTTLFVTHTTSLDIV